MLRLILAIVLVAACLAFPAEKESGPSRAFQQAFTGYNGPAGFGGEMPGAGMMDGMNSYGNQFQGFPGQQPQKRDPSHHEGHHSELQAFGKHRFGNVGSDGGDSDNFDTDFSKFFGNQDY